MSEHLKISELEIVWPIGKSTVRLAGMEIDVDATNSAFWTFSKAPMMNHLVFYIQDRMKRIFIDPHVQEDVFTRLAGAGITHVKAEHPSPELLEMFWETEMDDLDAELDYYEEYGEYPSYGA